MVHFRTASFIATKPINVLQSTDTYILLAALIRNSVNNSVLYIFLNHALPDIQIQAGVA